MSKYIYKINLLVDGETEDLQKQNMIDEIIDKAIVHLKSNMDISVLSYQLVEVNNQTENHGICLNCGVFTSDHTKPDPILEASNGAKVDGKWFCDLCLPEDHPNHF